MRTATSIPSCLMVVGLLIGRTALAQSTNELFDVIKFLEYDIYDYRPEEQAAREEFRYSKQALRVDLGSVTLKKLFAIAEAQANLMPVPWLGAHLELEDFPTRDQGATRRYGDF